MPTHRLLLDTHVFLWWKGNDRRLRASVRSAIAEADVVFVSAASAWEAAIKAQLGRLDLQIPSRPALWKADLRNC